MKTKLTSNGMHLLLIDEEAEIKEEKTMTEYKTIPNFEDYEISKCGSLRRKQNLKGSWSKGNLGTIIKKGYKRAGLYKNGKIYFKGVHKWVALTYIPNPNNFEDINHKDGNKLNNCVDNLEWCDKSYNTAYNKVLGINVKGEQIGTAKLTNADVLIIKECLSCGVEQNVLADKFSVNRLTIHGISTNKQWNHIIFNKLPKRSPNINYYTILEIEKLLNQGKSQNEIHKLLKVSHKTIIKVKNKVYEEYKTCYRKYILNGI